MCKIAIFFITLLFSTSVFPCGCDKPHSSDEVLSYVHIFKGRVLSVTQEDEFIQSVHFKVLDLIAGPAIKEISVTFGGFTSCDLETPNFIVGQTYLISDHNIYLEKDNAGITDPKKLKPSGMYNSNYCSLRELLTSEGEK